MGIRHLLFVFDRSIKIAWYSGYSELPYGFDCKSFEYVKLGGYIEEMGSLKSGTSNQQLFRVRQDGSLKDISCLFRVV